MKKFYIKVNGVPGGVTIAYFLGPILDNIFLSHHGENWVNKCPVELKPTFYRRYEGGTFVPFASLEFSHSYQKIHFLTTRTSISALNMRNLANFSVVKIFCKSNKFVTSVYRKPAFN